MDRLKRGISQTCDLDYIVKFKNSIFSEVAKGIEFSFLRSTQSLIVRRFYTCKSCLPAEFWFELRADDAEVLVTLDFS